LLHFIDITYTTLEINILLDLINYIHFSFTEEFCTNVPKNPIRILHETKLYPNFRFVLII